MPRPGHRPSWPASTPEHARSAATRQHDGSSRKDLAAPPANLEDPVGTAANNGHETHAYATPHPSPRELVPLRARSERAIDNGHDPKRSPRRGDPLRRRPITTACSASRRPGQPAGVTQIVRQQKRRGLARAATRVLLVRESRPERCAGLFWFFTRTRRVISTCSCVPDEFAHQVHDVAGVAPRAAEVV